ncbi:hypothetical protein WICMUC_001489 [Wickerhamomyces mucosus]|uniref:Uncharacterized protein n=1 Tax=Wickerhamomyces mucosus TaxID=1378264 RepID=A0A9P8PUN5_9ASCO|nr:hypothetical protein WICMUC_001489 [Wickerhamomyces mucosus]
MSLVQYSSSDESDSDINTKNDNKFDFNNESISNYLPKPKNNNIILSKAKNLGSNIKNDINNSIIDNPDNIKLIKSKRSITSFIPSSLRNINKPGINNTGINTNNTGTNTNNTGINTNNTGINANNTSINYELFESIKTKPKSRLYNESISNNIFNPIVNEQVNEQIDEKVNDPNLKKKKLDIQEFNISEYYSNNIELKSKGLLSDTQQQQHLHEVINPKNQLTSLIKNANLDKDLLQKRHDYNNQMKKMRKNQYGW